MTYYCTLARARVELDAKEVDAEEGQVLLDKIDQVSRRIDNLMQSDLPYFAPFLESRQVLVERGRVNSTLNTFRLDGNLLELTSVQLGGATLVVGSDVEAFPPSMSPIKELRLKRRDLSWYDASSITDDDLLFVTVTGVWGYRRRGATRWLRVGTLGAGIDDSESTLSMTGLSGETSTGGQPKLSPGSLIRIGSEYMPVLSTNGDSDRFEVIRGDNGTTAAAHALGDAIEVWQVEEPIAHVTAKQAALLYSRQGAYETRVADGMGGATVYPSDLLAELKGALNGYVKRK